MKKISGLLLLGFALLSNTLFAQTYSDLALYYSRIRPGGSARIQAMGGAQVSLGGDYSSATSNPAGIGMYNKSELAFTPSLGFSNVNSNYFDNPASTSKSTLSLPGFSVAFHKDYNRTEGFLGGTFAITYNRVNDFNQNFTYSGTNPNNSIILSFLNQAEGYPPSQFDAPSQSNNYNGGDLYNTITGLGYDNYLIGESTVLDPNNDPTHYFSDLEGAVPFQKETVETRGGQNQWNFSYGANFNDKFFLGAGVGFTSLRFKSKKIYSETFSNEPLNDMQLQENLDISGSGVNLNLGGIFRPTDGVQVGLSVSTPTFYQITDTYNATMSTRWNNFQYDANTVLNNESSYTDAIVSEYSLNTPWKLSAGVTYFFGKSGLITADIEQMSYNHAKYKTSNSNSYTSDDANYDNNKIKSLYRNTTNLRLGGEYRYKLFRFRAGTNYMADPFADDQDGVKKSIMGFSGGLGYRTSRFYVDLAVTYFQGKNSYRPYVVNDPITDPLNPLVKYDQKNTNVMLTFGFPF